MFARSATLPALRESAGLRYVTFAALYFAQGIPNGLTFFAMPAWLSARGCSPAVGRGLVDTFLPVVTVIAATQFTLYMAISNLGLSAGAWVFGALSEVLTTPQVLTSYLVLGGLAFAMLRAARLVDHAWELDRLEDEWLSSAPDVVIESPVGEGSATP